MTAYTVDQKTRSRIMRAIRGQNTNPELVIRKGLFKRGYRYRLHRKDLPGKPDLTLAKYGAVIFVHGCFWHGHNCHLFSQPRSNVEYWEQKIASNKRRDAEAQEKLIDNGWRVLVVWECSIHRKDECIISKVVDYMEKWLSSEQLRGEVRSGESWLS